ncbi:MAG: DUF1080 domain-containing protein [Verrucomicrobiaceae bacterium]|nr:DUF1080 domain-containing protein [Verrucomicrobiaceae bacterium]
MRLLITLLAVSALAHADDWTPEPGFISLFNGKDLSGWCYRAKTKKDDPKPGEILTKFDGKVESEDHYYSAKDGVIRVNFPTEADKLTGQLYTVAEFPKNFVLKLEFRAAVNADSGVFIRKPQLQCRDYLVAGPYKELKNYKPQEWNTIEVTVKDGVAHCTCNGEVLEAALALPPTGPIGLEGDRSLMEYRHLQLKELP